MSILDLLQDKNYPQKAILEKLICHSTGISKAELFTKADQPLEEEQKNRIQRAYSQYTKEKKPLEYILWYAEFLHYKFIVTPDTLIPRPETEYMIEAICDEVRWRRNEVRWKKIKSNQRSNLVTTTGTLHLNSSDTSSDSINIIDVWTWCGVLWLSVLLHNPGMITQAYFTDISEKALEVAKQNYKNLSQEEWTPNTPVQFLKADLLDHPAIKKKLQAISSKLQVKNKKMKKSTVDASHLTSSDTSSDFIIIIANLPYIPEELFDNNTDETVKKREPKMAFVWGDDGLDLYREMFDQILELKATSEKLQAQQSIHWDINTSADILKLTNDKNQQDQSLHLTSSETLHQTSSKTLHLTSSETSSDLICFLEMMTRQVDILRQEYPQMSFQEVKTFHFNIRIVKARFVQKSIFQ